MAREQRIWNVPAWLRQLPAPVFAEWRAFYDYEGFVEERADLRAAYLMLAMLEVHTKRPNVRKLIKDLFAVVTPVTGERPSGGVDWNKLKGMAKAFAANDKD